MFLQVHQLKRRCRSTALNNAKEAKPSGPKRSTFERRESKEYPILPPFPCGVKSAIELLKQRVKEESFVFPTLNASLQRQTKEPQTIALPLRRGHSLE